MEKLLKKLDTLLELTEDFGKIKHLFSKDEGIKTLAKIHETAGKIKWEVKASTLKEVGHPDGKPIKDALINYRYYPSRSREPDAKFITKTDTDGFFIIENLSENISLLDSEQFIVGG